MKVTAAHMTGARKIAADIERRGTNQREALVAALAQGIALTERVRQLESSSGQTLADGTKIVARRNADGRLVISRVVDGREQMMLSTP